MKLGILAAMGLSLVVAATGRLTRIGAVQATGTLVAARDLAFADGVDGSVIVTDAPVGPLAGAMARFVGALDGVPAAAVLE